MKLLSVRLTNKGNAKAYGSDGKVISYREINGLRKYLDFYVQRDEQLSSNNFRKFIEVPNNILDVRGLD